MALPSTFRPPRISAIRFRFHNGPLASYDTPFGQTLQSGPPAEPAGMAVSECTGAVPMWVFRVLLGNLSLFGICKLHIPIGLW
jgi:hypothetical protein